MVAEWIEEKVIIKTEEYRMYCSKCGKFNYSQNIRCMECGTPLFNPENNSNTNNSDNKTKDYERDLQIECQRRFILNEIASKEKISGILWIIIACLQILLGLEINLDFIFIGVYNIIIGILRLNLANKIRADKVPDIIKKYNEAIISSIIFGFINFFGGGIIGVAAVGYDIYVRNYVLKNKKIFEYYDK